MLFGLVLLVLIPLAIGLGVGLDPRRHRSKSAWTATPSETATTVIPGRLWRPLIVLSQPIVASDVPTITPDVDVYDVDLFDTPPETIAALHARGKHVVCYFSAGSYEAWRTDAARFDKGDLGSALRGWQGENWVKTGSPTVRAVMISRIQLAVSKGCDAIDPDNVDAYNNANGLGLTTADAIDFVKFLASTAAGYNMSIGLKNAGDIIPSVLSSVDFSVNEQCAEYKECDKYAAFVKAGKPVFHIEYPGDAPNPSSSELDAACNSSGTKGFSTVIKKMSLDKWVQYCNDQKAN
ncbi:putative protein [Vanrija pseudolonga]|uniref:alpha-galactosidase n=1 Tax=Vanrija pseudolonga TaxID=143232 RepID=A0AAF0Y4P1_9TREE|nr:purtative protein [Vanrija pseudolonga]